MAYPKGLVRRARTGSNSLASIDTTGLIDLASAFVFEDAAKQWFVYILNITSTTTPDGTNVIQPTVGPGRWHLLAVQNVDDGPEYPPLLHIQDQKSNGSAGGSAGAGFNIRVLNTVLTNEITGASLSANCITLPAGIYDIVALAPCYNVRDNKLFLKKTSDDTTILIGHGEYTRQGSDVAEGAGVDARVIGRFTLAVETELKLSHWMQVASQTYGLGSVGHSTEANEVYTDVRIWQIQEGV